MTLAAQKDVCKEVPVVAPVLGAHVHGGMKGGLAKAREIGAQVIQIFVGSPQMWKDAVVSDEEAAKFRCDLEAAQLGPVFVHGNYLVNLAAADRKNLDQSIGKMRKALFTADQIGAAGLIFHPGSAGQTSYPEALQRLLSSLQIVLADYGGNAKLILEVCAGQGQTIGARFSELADILHGLGNDKRLGICWDTCHLFAAGYDVATADGLKRTMEEFHACIGFEWLMAVHANDSKTPLGGRRDRHENIGKGFIGEAAFHRMLSQPELRTVPWILEVPGMEKKGPDKANMEILRRLAATDYQ